MKSLNKALDVMELFLNLEDEVRLSELARLAGLDRATVNRIVSTLVDRGYLKQPEVRGKYSLGSKFLDFSGLIKKRSKIRDIAMPYMLKLSHLANESVMLAVPDGQMAAYSETIPADHPLRIVPDEGTQFPLYCTGVGKIFLAEMTKEKLNAYLSSKPLEKHTNNTITDINQLKTHLGLVLKEEVAFDDEEYLLGVRNIASGVKNNEGQVIAAVGVLGPSIRLTRSRMLEIVPDVKNCAKEISKELGYSD
jgi:IclR family KDG regulon transcriptional repressor